MEHDPTMVQTTLFGPLSPTVAAFVFVPIYTIVVGVLAGWLARWRDYSWRARAWRCIAITLICVGAHHRLDAIFDAADARRNAPEVFGPFND
jgi:hypothetical protein